MTKGRDRRDETHGDQDADDCSAYSAAFCAFVAEAVDGDWRRRIGRTLLRPK